MALFTRPQLYERVNNELRKSVGFEFPEKRAAEFLNEAKRVQKTFSERKYDVFLSHSSDDKVEVIGLKLLIEDLGYSVYIDWINDPELDRTNVTKTNANVLRTRMKHCSVLFYAFSEHAANSTWMPWELGYFDGQKGLVAVIPISPNQARTSFKGNEFIGLYPYVDFASMKGAAKNEMWVNESSDVYVTYSEWIKGKNPYKRTS